MWDSHVNAKPYLDSIIEGSAFGEDASAEI